MDPTPRIPLPEPVLEVARRLAEHGHDALLVGGAVRDALLDRPATLDFDLVTDAPTPTIRDIARATPGVRSTYDVGERFGTLGIALEPEGRLEVSRYRATALDSAAPSATRFAADARLRDLTVNAIAVDLASHTLLDPAHGRADLTANILRAPGNPRERFAEDPLRVLRAARFAAELGFDLDPATAAALPAAAPDLARTAAERIREELTKLLLAPHAPTGLELLHECGALATVLPEVAALDGLTQPTFHDLDVLAHTIQAVGLAPPTPTLRWATLLHDVGKAPTRSVDPSGRIRFLGHAQAGADIAAAVLARLRFPVADARAITHLVATHMRLGEIDLDNPRSVDRAVRKLDLRAGGPEPHLLATTEDAVELTLADFAATAHRAEAPALRERLETAIAASRERGTHRAVVSPISGGDIMRAFDLTEGPSVGVAKRAVERAVERGDLSAGDIEGAYAVAEAALAARNPGDPGRDA